MNQRAVVCVEILTNIRVDATRLTAGRFNLWTLATNTVHVGGWATQVGNHSGKARHLVANVFNLANHGIFTTALDDSPFVLRDRAERTATKTASHDVHTKADHLPGRNLSGPVVAAVFICINRMRAAGIRKIKHQIHFSSRQRDRWWRDPNVASCASLTVSLHNSSCISWVGLEMQHTVCMCIQYRIRLDLLVGGQTNHAAITWRDLELAWGLQGWIWRKHKRRFARFKFCLGIRGISDSTRFIVTCTTLALLERLLTNH